MRAAAAAAAATGLVPQSEFRPRPDRGSFSVEPQDSAIEAAILRVGGLLLLKSEGAPERSCRCPNTRLDSRCGQIFQHRAQSHATLL